MHRVPHCVFEQGWLPSAQISGEEKPGITHPDSHIWRYFLSFAALNSALANLHHSDLPQRKEVMIIAVMIIVVMIITTMKLVLLAVINGIGSRQLTRQKCTADERTLQ